MIPSWVVAAVLAAGISGQPMAAARGRDLQAPVAVTAVDAVAEVAPIPSVPTVPGVDGAPDAFPATTPVIAPLPPLGLLAHPSVKRKARSEDLGPVLADADPSQPSVVLQREVERATGQARVAMKNAQRSLSRIRFGIDGPDALRILVLPADDAGPDAVDKIREELAIMDRILAKSVDTASGVTSAGSPRRNRNLAMGDMVLFGNSRFGTRGDLDSMYVAGSGAVFLLGVDFPLIETPVAEAPKEQAGKKPDDTWEKARRELRGENSEVDEDAVVVDDSVPFDAARVQKLRDELAGALRHAGNLKCLRDGETVSIVVTGRGQKGNAPETKRVVRYGDGATITTDNYVGSADGAGKTDVTVMTLRATKGDIEAFASGKTDAAEFARHVKATTRRDNATPPAGRIGGRNL